MHKRVHHRCTAPTPTRCASRVPNAYPTHWTPAKDNYPKSHPRPRQTTNVASGVPIWGAQAHHRRTRDLSVSAPMTPPYQAKRQILSTYYRLPRAGDPTRRRYSIARDQMPLRRVRPPAAHSNDPPANHHPSIPGRTQSIRRQARTNIAASQHSFL